MQVLQVWAGMQAGLEESRGRGTDPDTEQGDVSGTDEFWCPAQSVTPLIGSCEVSQIWDVSLP